MAKKKLIMGGYVKERGAYDKNPKWWTEADIKNHSDEVIELFFGVSRDKIKILERSVQNG